MKKYVFVVLLALFITIKSAAAAITAEVSGDTQPLGQAFTLTLTADENVSSSPDLSVLNQNFKVYSTSISRQNYIINGKASATTVWQIGLIALTAGEQEIPAIKVGNESSSPLKITITDGFVETSTPKKAPLQQEGMYKLQAEVINPEKPYYVQQQINYEVVLTDNGSIISGNPQFADTNSDWIIVSLGNPQISTVKAKNGQMAREVTFKYAIFPQKSGKLQMPAVWFDGYAQGKGNSLNTLLNQDIFKLAINTPSLFGLETPVSLKADSQEINILPVPADYSGKWWLPAQKVELSADWIGEKPEFKSGEPVSRLITLKASGVTENQLPEINFKSAEWIKQYPERSSRQGKIVAGTPVAEQTVVNVYVPDKSGKLILPEIAVDWYNTTSGRIEKAVIPAEEITVSSNGTKAPIVTKPAKAEAPLPSVPEPQPVPLYVYIAIAFVGGLILGFVLFKCRFTSIVKPQCEPRAYPDFLIKKAYTADFRGLRDGLISWATGFYPEKPINNLKDVANAAADSEFSSVIDVILAKLYNPHDESMWNPKDFTAALKRVIKQKKRQKSKSNTLPPLYE